MDFSTQVLGPLIIHFTHLMKKKKKMSPYSYTVDALHNTYENKLMYSQMSTQTLLQ